MNKSLKILLLEDSLTDAELIQRVLKKERPDWVYCLAIDKEAYLRELDLFQPDLVLSDNSVPRLNATEALEIARKRALNIPFILVTGTVSDEFAAAIIKSGADDYVLKDRLQRLPAVIEAGLKNRKAEKEIKDYKYALDQSSIISMADEHGIITYANENFCKISKYGPEELIGQNHRIINSGYHPESYIKNFWKTISGGNIWRGEFRNRAKDGSIYWVDTTVVPFLSHEGIPYQYLAIRADITERKQMEQALQNASDRVFFHVDNSPLAFIEWDNRNRPTSWSKRAEEIFGWTETEIKSGKINWLSKVYEEDLPWVSKIAEQLVKGNVEKFQVQHRNYTKDGRVIWCEWFNSVLRDKNGTVFTILSLVQDITEKKQAEVNLKKSEERLNEAQAIVHISNWEIDFIHGIQTWSDELYRIFGINKAEAEPSTELFLSFMHPEDADFARKKLEEAITYLKESTFSFRFVRMDGIMRYGCTEWKFEFDKNGKAIRLYGIVQDITHRKKAEAELKESHDEMRELASHMQDVREEERASMSREIHDELGQQLTVLKMDVSWLSKRKELATPVVLKKLKSLKGMLDNTVITVRKIASELRPSMLDDLGLVAAMEWYLKEFQNRSNIKTNFPVHTVNESNLSMRMKTGLYRIFQESLTNVARHASAIHVSATIEERGNYLLLTITDDGQGFDLYKSNGKKTLGLMGMKERTIMLGGEFSLSSQPGKGTVVAVSIPLLHKT